MIILPPVLWRRHKGKSDTPWSWENRVCSQRSFACALSVCVCTWHGHHPWTESQGTVGFDPGWLSILLVWKFLTVMTWNGLTYGPSESSRLENSDIDRAGPHFRHGRSIAGYFMKHCFSAERSMECATITLDCLKTKCVWMKNYGFWYKVANLWTSNFIVVIRDIYTHKFIVWNDSEQVTEGNFCKRKSLHGRSSRSQRST